MTADASPAAAPTAATAPTAGAPATPAPADPAVLDGWVDRVAALLELPAQEVDVALVLDLARDAAHGIARPAAPLTTFLLGLAVGRAGGGAADARRLAAEITAEIDHMRDPVGPVAPVGGAALGEDLLRADQAPPVPESDLGGRA
ncbi:DUF6457 domain-containing protein [Clavibacter sp. km1a]|uniref:DUF6457 domain-containing protein n=1 Tax=Clavibacter sp. km1a TaxID=3459136 RepID=UPI004042110E